VSGQLFVGVPVFLLQTSPIWPFVVRRRRVLVGGRQVLSQARWTAESYEATVGQDVSERVELGRIAEVLCASPAAAGITQVWSWAKVECDIAVSMRPSIAGDGSG
jgi:hypothetical protein